MFEVGVVGQFEAAHQLVGDFGPATRLHGHTYRVEVLVRGSRLDETCVLFDVGRLQNALAGTLGELNYRRLDELDGLRGSNTTAEVIARHIHDRLADRLSLDSNLSLWVRVWESPQVFATYQAGGD